MYDIEKVNGRYFEAYLPENPTCCMSCMFNTMTCGTQKMSMKFYVDKDGVGKGTEATVCGCVRLSPVPCFMCCGYGPLAMEPKSHRKEGTDEWIGGGQVCAGGCCPCMDNQGDFMIINDAHDGSTPEKYAVLIVREPPRLNEPIAPHTFFVRSRRTLLLSRASLPVRRLAPAPRSRRASTARPSLP